MRTSKLAKDTAKLFSALTSPPKTRRRSARFSTAAAEEIDDVPVKEHDAQASTAVEIKEEPLTPTRKRKRTVETPDPRKIIKQEETVITRTSPRKPGVVADGTDRPKKGRRQPAKQIKGPDGTVAKTEPPANWEEMYAVTREMRKLMLAPVDTMGCESLAEEHRTPRDQRFQTLVSLMLSSQTKDTVTAVAMRNLQQQLPGGFTLESVLAVEPQRLNEMINKVGFHNNKTKFIKAAAEILRDKFNSDIPDTIEGLISLPGVGPKMAYLCMSAAWGRDEGIGVDVHVHRITNLWGWHKTSTPEQTREILESWLPKDKWHDINNLLVGFGQTWCPPVGRKCEVCKLSEKGLCPSAVVSRSVKASVKKEAAVVKVEGSPSKNHQKVDVKLEEQETTVADFAASLNGVPDMEDIGRRPPRAARSLA